jgi:hypothetical protein
MKDFIKTIINNVEIVLDLIFILLLLFIGFSFLKTFEDFYDDYKCSTTNNVEYYNNHNCKRFER